MVCLESGHPAVRQRWIEAKLVLLLAEGVASKGGIGRLGQLASDAEDPGVHANSSLCPAANYLLSGEGVTRA